MSGDIWVVTLGDATDTKSVEARGANNHPTAHRTAPTTKDYGPEMSH